MKDIVRWILLPLAFLPIVIDSGVLFPFIFPKTFAVRMIVALFWALFSSWLILDRKRIVKVARKRIRFIKNPVFLFTLGFFVFLMIISTIFAENPFRAFYGDIERGEGLLGILNFIGFFVGTLLVFEKKDWMNFFKLSIFMGGIIFFDALIEFQNGVIRPESTSGNPAFLAVIFLFLIFASLIVFFSKQGRVWKHISLTMIPIGIMGVLITGTRGAILGLISGIIFVAIFFAFKKSNTKINLPNTKISFKLQNLSISFLVLLILFIGGFILTNDSAIWQSIPGISRFADISFEDPTIQTRIISSGVSLNAINPANEGVLRFLIGWGPDNFNIAYNKYYNPDYMRYESLWFDRAHNKIFDVLVMNGILGLILYIGIWISLFYICFRKIKEKGYSAAILFFSGAYFVQNLFLFDQISTYILFLSLFAFSVFIGSGEYDENLDISGRFYTYFKNSLLYLSVIFSIFLIFTLFFYTFVPYRQSKLFIEALRSRDLNILFGYSDGFLEPYNFAQKTIRDRYLRELSKLSEHPQYDSILNGPLSSYKETIMREYYDPRDIMLLGNVYHVKASLGDVEAISVSEKYFLDALKLAPARQDVLYRIALFYNSVGKYEYAQNYLDIMMEQSSNVPRTRLIYGIVIFQEGENRYTESMDKINSAINDEKIYFISGELGKFRDMYNSFIEYQASIGDGENFRNALDGALQIEVFIEKAEQGFLSPSLIDGLDPANKELYIEKIRLYDEEGLIK